MSEKTIIEITMIYETEGDLYKRLKENEENEENEITEDNKKK